LEGDLPYLEVAAVIEVENLPHGILILGRPLDRSLLGEWAARTRASLLLSDGHRALFADPTLRSDSLVGQEAQGPIVDEGAGWVADPLSLAQGLWVWSIRPLPQALAGTLPIAPLLALAGVLAVAALAVGVASRRASDPAPEAPVNSVAFIRGTRAPSGQVPVQGSRATPPARARSATSPTLIAGGDPLEFGRYTVISRLGEGGMCELFIAGLTGPEGFQRPFVLKRLKPEIERNRAAVDQFIDEAKLGSTLVHSNIVPVFDFGQVGDSFFMAQEYVVGRNVGEIIERHLERLREPLDVATVLYIVHEALQALAYAHEKINDQGEPFNLVHRDVSPGNVLVSSGGEVKLIDFGIAKSEGRVSRTDIGSVKGNAAFMAPEQARGLAIDRRADLFSLGLVAYYALTGEPLYKGATNAELLYVAASGPSAERMQRLNGLPALVVQILGRALATDPAERYPTAEEFAADIADHVAPVGARAAMATLLNALFGPELHPASGAGGVASAGTSGVRRRAS
jgi:serine/threonine-protein kinase